MGIFAGEDVFEAPLSAGSETGLGVPDAEEIVIEGEAGAWVVSLEIGATVAVVTDCDACAWEGAAEGAVGILVDVAGDLTDGVAEGVERSVVAGPWTDGDPCPFDGAAEGADGVLVDVLPDGVTEGAEGVLVDVAGTGDPGAEGAEGVSVDVVCDGEPCALDGATEGAEGVLVDVAGDLTDGVAEGAEGFLVDVAGTGDPGAEGVSADVAGPLPDCDVCASDGAAEGAAAAFEEWAVEDVCRGAVCEPDEVTAERVDSGLVDFGDVAETAGRVDVTLSLDDRVERGA